MTSYSPFAITLFINSDPVGVRGEAAESSVDSTVQQVEVLTLCDEEVQE